MELYYNGFLFRAEFVYIWYVANFIHIYKWTYALSSGEYDSFEKSKVLYLLEI